MEQKIQIQIQLQIQKYQVPISCIHIINNVYSVGLFESFGTLLGFVQNRKSMQTLSFVLFKFWFQNKD